MSIQVRVNEWSVAWNELSLLNLAYVVWSGLPRHAESVPVVQLSNYNAMVSVTKINAVNLTEKHVVMAQ